MKITSSSSSFPSLWPCFLHQKLILVCLNFLFHKFDRNAAKNEAPKGIVNEHLLCSKHGNLLYPLDGLDSLVKWVLQLCVSLKITLIASLILRCSDKLILVSEGEWEILSQMYPADETIYVRRNPRNGKSVGNESITFTSHPREFPFNTFSPHLDHFLFKTNGINLILTCRHSIVHLHVSSLCVSFVYEKRR